ncbi:hypothetical protein LQZ18_11330 [Lachnospiraceae bacterium ZAX-1]
MYWILDVVFAEDECRLESEESNKTLNSFRKLAILVHRTYVKSNKLKISGKQSILKAMLDENHLLQIIGSFHVEIYETAVVILKVVLTSSHPMRVRGLKHH